MGDAEARRTVEAVWRMESARVIAGLAGLVRDVGWAEELAQDAVVAALEQWPRDGVPDNPSAWRFADVFIETGSDVEIDIRPICEMPGW